MFVYELSGCGFKSSCSPYLTAHITINNETSCVRRFSEKKNTFRTIAAAKKELFVALVSSFQLLSNLTKNPNIGAMGILYAPVEYCYNVF